MSLFDYHIHTDGSFDCEEPMMEQVLAAKRAGISEICFTDHADLDPCVKKNYPPIDFEKIKQEFAKAKELPGIDVKLGVELGVYKENIDEYRAFLADKELDFIICSQHYVIDCDPYFADVYFKGLTQKEAYDKYLTEIYRTISLFDEYSVVGHIGYVTNYYPGPEPKALDYSKHSDIIDAILKKAIEKGKGIEVNTGGIGRTGYTLPTPQIIKRYLELGGEIITTGSDSHVSSVTGAHIAEATEMLKALGCKYICTFDRMKPVFNRI